MFSTRTEIDAQPQTGLLGLVLAGGRGSRLGCDKGALDYHGVPQAQWAARLLAARCRAVYVSIRPDQAMLETYADLTQIPDQPGMQGPAAGLVAALRHDSRAAWLVIAADMPLLDDEMLDCLVGGRDPAAIATAFRNAEGVPEPLCAIWEPRCLPMLECAGPNASLRGLLAQQRVRFVVPLDFARLRSVNTAGDDAFVRAQLAR